MKKLEKKIKKLDCWDFGLIKLSVVAFVLWILTAWPASMAWANSVNHIYFLFIWIVLAIRPFYRIWIKG